MRYVILLSLAALVAGCANAPDWLSPAPRPDSAAESPGDEAPDAVRTASATPPPRTARTVEEFDTTTDEAKAAAVKPSAGGKDLGLTIASLGAAGEPGFWLKTPLVSAPGPGRVVYPANGKTVQVDLIPLGGEPGAGSRMSLAALRLLEAPLTGLLEVRVFSLP
ncbi:hypothetical protein DC366_02820 [Pelagivirga sediminicola]|uniref:D-galactarate dehydratase n=1 Tax=Pelagivirga sediminicola TaxID=2170575 RepID=A0A2T7GBU7_9RHOB|nr:hypothetical protein [Pelagivirga sediminicola]PVA11883.1 hypothetical protein DC366_02820 [Pelagivirga sediminicola]